MNAVDRYNLHKEDEFDRIITLIRNGNIRAGRYIHMVKDKDWKDVNLNKLFDSKGGDKHE